MDIKTIANLTLGSRTKLSQAKSKGLTHTLITEDIISGKSWNDLVTHWKIPVFQVNWCLLGIRSI